MQNVSRKEGVVLEAWREIGDYAKGMRNMLKAWGPCQRQEDHAKGMGTMPQA